MAPGGMNRGRKNPNKLRLRLFLGVEPLIPVFWVSEIGKLYAMPGYRKDPLGSQHEWGGHFFRFCLSLLITQGKGIAIC